MPNTLTDRLDWVLDKSVVLGYTRLGPTLRRRWWPADPGDGSMDGKRVIITGGGSGIGRAAARQLGSLGATVHLLGADVPQLDQARTELAAEAPAGHFETEVCDLADLPQVADWARGFAGRGLALHALVNNAGTMSPTRKETAQGHELTVATHVLGPHLMTRELVEPLAADGDGRVVWVTSGGMYASRLRTDDLEFTRTKYSGEAAYARTKRMQMVLAELWADELAGRGVSVHSMHPGWVDTPGVRHFLTASRNLTVPFIRSADQGADTITWLVASPQPASATGLFWHDRLPRPTTYFRQSREDEDQRRLLWTYCQSAVEKGTGGVASEAGP